MIAFPMILISFLIVQCFPELSPGFLMFSDLRVQLRLRFFELGCADWACRKIAEEKAELDRIRELADAQIQKIEEKVAAADPASFRRSRLPRSRRFPCPRRCRP